MRRTFVIFLFAMLTAQFAAAFGSDLEAALNHQYKKRNYSLRHPVIDNDQHFDSSGKLLSVGSEGPWTLYGRLNIRKIRLKSDKLTVDADRVGYAFDSRRNRLAPRKAMDSVRLEISLDQPLTSSEQADVILGRIFAFSKEDLLASLPPWWRAFMETHVEPSPRGGDLEMKAQEDVHPRPDPSAPMKDESGVYRAAGRVTRPQPVSTPDPSYNDIARRARFSGTNAFEIVVDETGKVTDYKLLRAAGLGLEEQSVQKFLTWSFRPGMLDDKPVKVKLVAEFNFNLY